MLKKWTARLRKLFKPRQSQVVTNSTVGGKIIQIQSGRDIHL